MTPPYCKRTFDRIAIGGPRPQQSIAKEVNIKREYGVYHPILRIDNKRFVAILVCGYVDNVGLRWLFR